MDNRETIDFDKGGGLVPVIVQESSTQAVLMCAYMDRAALQQTIETGMAHYYSRSRNRIWRKGETSGHVQRVEELWVDCDADAILLRVRQQGVACHTGHSSCFYRRYRDGRLEEES